MDYNLIELQKKDLLEISGGGFREDAFIAGAIFEFNRRLAIGAWNRIKEKWND